MTYSSEDVQQILQRALARGENEFSREHLLEMASELGVSAEALQLAEQEWLSEQQQARDRSAFNAYRHRAFKSHLISFLAVNTFLILLNLVASPGSFWAIYPLLGWGLGLFLQGWSTYQTEGEGYERAFQSWQRFHRSPPKAG